MSYLHTKFHDNWISRSCDDKVRTDGRSDPTPRPAFALATQVKINFSETLLVQFSYHVICIQRKPNLAFRTILEFWITQRAMNTLREPQFFRKVSLADRHSTVKATYGNLTYMYFFHFKNPITKRTHQFLIYLIF